MSAAVATHMPSPVSQPGRSGRPLVLRRCPCGGTPGLDGECTSCRAKRLGLRRVPQAPGARTGESASRPGHDFSQIRVQRRAEDGAGDGPVADADSAAGGGAAPEPCSPAPEARLAAFRNANGEATSAENCCAVCPADLGVAREGRAANRMEMRVRIDNHCPGAEYDIVRVRESWLWHRVDGDWAQLEHQGPGVDDDHHDDDECLRLRRGRFLYVIDSPGWPGVALPAATGETWEGYSGAETDPAATEAVSQDTFAEWVIYRHRGHGIPWTPISTPRFLYWRSILSLTQDAAGWHLNAAESEIESGFRRAVVRP